MQTLVHELTYFLWEGNISKAACHLAAGVDPNRCYQAKETWWSPLRAATRFVQKEDAGDVARANVLSLLVALNLQDPTEGGILEQWKFADALAKDDDLRSRYDGIVGMATHPKVHQIMKEVLSESSFGVAFPAHAEALNSVLDDPEAKDLTKLLFQAIAVTDTNRRVCHTRRCGRECVRGFTTCVASALCSLDGTRRHGRVPDRRERERIHQ